MRKLKEIRLETVNGKMFRVVITKDVLKDINKKAEEGEDIQKEIIKALVKRSYIDTHPIGTNGRDRFTNSTHWVNMEHVLTIELVWEPENTNGLG